MKKFVCIGSLNFDIIHVVDRLPEEHENYRAKNTICQFGGSSSNTAYWLSKACSNVILIGCLGNDYIGDMYLDHLRSLKISTDYVQVTKNAATSILTVLTSKSSKRMISSGGANKLLDIDQIPFHIFDENTHIHIANSDKSKVKTILSKVKDRGSTTSIELREGFDSEIISNVDFSFINKDDFVRWYSKYNYWNYWHEKMPKDSALVITLGEQGAAYYKNNVHIIKKNENRIQVVDRTGGGDAFDAGFLIGWIKGNEFEVCLEQGLARAVEAITILGSRPQNHSL